MDKKMNDTAAQRLCMAIVRRAADDYRNALKVLKREPRDYRARLIWDKAKHDKEDVERFVRSGWYKELTEVDGDYLIGRLKKEGGFDMDESGMDTMYRACRWCRSYTGGKCMAQITKAGDEDGWAYAVAESGKLSEVLEEALGSADRKDFEDELKIKLKEYKLSKKCIDEFMGLFDECMGQFLDMKCKPVCDEDVSILYQNEESAAAAESEGIVIADPDGFYCSKFE